MRKKVITITEDFYIELMKSKIFLDMLFKWGVDNWGGISEAGSEYDEFLKNQEEFNKELCRYALEAKIIEVPEESNKDLNLN